MKPQWKDKSLPWKTTRRWIVVSVDAAVSGSSVCLVQCIVGRDWKMIWYSQEHFYQAHTGERDQISPLRKGSVKNEFVVLKLTGNELKRSSSRLPACVLWTVTAAERRRAFVGRRRLVKSRAVHSWEVQLCVRVCVCLQLQTPDSVTARLRNGHKKMNQLKKDERETQKYGVDMRREYYLRGRRVVVLCTGSFCCDVLSCRTKVFPLYLFKSVEAHSEFESCGDDDDV